jgi:eukaryotic-like serine/threonine-protein kinase
VSQPVRSADCFKFGDDFELDARAYELRSGGVPLKLKPIPMELLLLLVERRGELVTREQIVERLWGNRVALDTDNSINGAISRIRQVLRDDPERPKCVLTVPSRGYRFIATVEITNREKEAPAALEPSEFAVPPGALAGVAGAQAEVIAASQPIAVPSIDRRDGMLSYQWRKYAVGAALVAAFAVGWAWRARAKTTNRLSARDTIVVADFVNNAGDPIFDETLKQALSVQLTQSPFLNVASDLKVSEVLGRMGRPANTELSGETAREVCLRLGGKAILAGSISSLGSHYLVGLQALGCASGDILAASQMEAPNKEGVLKALDGAAAQVRGKVGESMASLEKYDFPADATTKSLEALKAFSLGVKELREHGEGEAIPFLRQATEIDGDFALAYATLGRAYEDVGEDNAAAEDFGKAFQLRDRLSERERYYVTTMYNETVTGDLQKAQESGELWVRAYPRDGIAREKLGTIYGELGDLGKAQAEFAEALRLDPESTINVSNSVMVEASLEQTNSAEQLLQGAKERGVDGAPIHQATYALAFLRGDRVEMEREVAWSHGKAITEEDMLSQHADSEAFSGHMRKAADLSKRAVAASVRDNANEMAALCALGQALREVESGDRSSAAEVVREAIGQAPSRNVKILAALVLARSGDRQQATGLLQELESTYPTNTLIRFYWLPVARASLDLENGDASAALAKLEEAAPYERSQPSNLSNVTNLYPVYVRGEAYLAARNGRAATIEFQKIVNNPGLVQNGILGALARLQLARAQAATGDAAGARKSYSDFLGLWKAADTGIPILKTAKAESALAH